MIPFKSSFINYVDKGQGKVVVLIHGYLESLEIWDGFADELARNFRVIAIDLPGHGLSGLVADILDMELMAEAVEVVLRHLKIDRAFLIGHSMGGYVAIACLSHYRRMFSGICLFHSTPFADSEKKRAGRDREICVVKQGSHARLIDLSVPNSFAAENLERLKPQIERVIAIAQKTDPSCVIATLEGMKIRVDRQLFLKDNAIPVLFILGKKDKIISFDLMYAVAQRSSIGEVLALENSAHMGFIEEPDVCLKAITSFVLQYS